LVLFAGSTSACCRIWNIGVLQRVNTCVRVRVSNHLHAGATSEHADVIELVHWRMCVSSPAHFLQRLHAPFQGIALIGPLISISSPGLIP
jgi:hypothetical protein